MLQLKANALSAEGHEEPFLLLYLVSTENNWVTLLSLDLTFESTKRYFIIVNTVQ